MITIKPCKDCGCPKVLPFMKEREGWWDIEKELAFDPELLKRAYINTIKWTLNKIKLIED